MISTLTFVIVLISACCRLIAAQSFSSLPQCGQTCVSNEIQLATSQRGCAVGNATCYCTQPDFGYGIRDCVNESCPSTADAQDTLAWGTQYCADALSSNSSTGASSSSSSQSASSSTSASSSPTTSTLSTSATTPTSTANAPASNPTSSPQETGAHHSKGLSTGASIGIGVAIAVVAIAAILGIGFLLWRRRSKKRQFGQDSQQYKAEEAEAGRTTPVILEKSISTKRSELSTQANRHELEQPPSELPAGRE